jgi:hypothetical protein
MAIGKTGTIQADLEGAEGIKKPAKKAKKKAKPQVDGIARFFNDYGESPHLQAIENSYLQFLEA